MTDWLSTMQQETRVISAVILRLDDLARGFHAIGMYDTASKLFALSDNLTESLDRIDAAASAALDELVQSAEIGYMATIGTALAMCGHFCGKEKED